MKSKQLQQQNDLNQQYVNLAKQREGAGLLQEGMQADPSGNVTYNPQQQQIHDVTQQTQLANTMRAQRNTDPNSPESQTKRNFMKQTLNEVSPGFGDHTIPDEMSGADLTEQEPLIGHLFNGLSADAKARITAQSGYDKALMQAQNKSEISDQVTKARQDMLEKQLNNQQLIQGMKGDQSKDKNDAAQEEKYQNWKTQNIQKISPMNATIRTGAGTAGQQLQRIQRLKQLLAGGNNLNKQQTEELAIGLQSVLGGGSGNGTQVQQLLPKSATGDVQSLMSYFTNNPEKLNQQSFVKPMADLLDREQSTIQGQLKSWQYPQVYSIENKIKKHGEDNGEDEIGEVLKMNSIDPADYYRYRQTGQVETPQAPQPQAAPKKAAASQYSAGKTYHLPDGNTYLFKGGNPKNKSNWEQQNGLGGLLNRGKGLLGL